MKAFHLIYLILTGVSFLIIINWYFSSLPVCLRSLPSDSPSFGFSLATSGNYLAVGDPDANRVVIYARNRSGRWFRTREIFPPFGSPADTVGSGFGYDLALDGAVLVIGAYTEKREATNPEDFQWTSQERVSVSGGVYRTTLDQETEVQRIDWFMEDEISGFSVAADRGRIAFTAIGKEQPGRWIRKVNLLSDGNIEYIVSPTDNEDNEFGVDIALKNHLLLVGSPSNDSGVAWLFDLKAPESKPQKLAAPNAYFGDTVAISERFAVVGDPGNFPYFPPKSVKTLIREIENGSITVIDGVGELSLDRNILARMRPLSDDGEQAALLELFNIDDIAAPRLIKKCGNIKRALLKNSLLMIVQKTASGNKLCIKQVP